jgi:hypothetical protein
MSKLSQTIEPNSLENETHKLMWIDFHTHSINRLN